MELIKIENKNGNLVVSSRVVAEQLGKEHRRVMQDCRDKLEVGAEFVQTSYIDSCNREQPEFLLTKDGFILLCMNYQGYNDFKRAYINEFNRMEKELNSQTKAPGTLKEALLLALEQQEKIEVLEIENKIKEQQIAEYKPRIEYLDTILKSQDTMTVTQIAADYGISGKRLNQILHEEKIQRKVGGQWLLYTNHMNNGYTKSETYMDVKGSPRINTKWTQKGRVKIHEILSKLGIMASMDKEKSA